MKRIALLSILLLAAAVAPTLLAADGEQTLEGEYHWTNADIKGPVKAVFTATGDNTWDVSFYFNFRDKDRTYTGTATGSLSDGSLSGVVKNENQRRTFTFEGTTTGGQFEGNHAETTGGGARETGTIVLKG